jgi:sporadic carbohydrate cluster 2OG-Fe(II) oxygenase
MINIEKKGWEIVETPNKYELDNLCGIILNEFKEFDVVAKDIKDLRIMLTNLEQDKRNYIKINFNTECSKQIAIIYKDIIKKIAGDKIYLQKKSHLQFNVPNNINTVTPPHADIIFGHSPHTYTIWTPLHEVDDKSGLFCVDKNESINIVTTEEKFGEKFSEESFNLDLYTPIKLKYGQSIIFSSLVVHGAWLNSAELTRISIDTRFQGVHKKLFEKNIDYFDVYEY